MKKKGNRCDFGWARDCELHRNFITLLGQAQEMTLAEMYAEAARQPSSRFWVSEIRAALVIGRIRELGPEAVLAGSTVKKREMYEEIWRRVREMMNADPGLCMTHAVAAVVCSPAPEFYLTAKSAKVMIYRTARKLRALRALRKSVS